MTTLWCQQWEDPDGRGFWAVYQRVDLIRGPDGWKRMGKPYQVVNNLTLDCGEMQDGLAPPPHKPEGTLREREAFLVAVYTLRLDAEEQSKLLPEGQVAKKAFYEGQRSACEILVAAISRGHHLELLDAQNPEAN